MIRKIFITIIAVVLVASVCAVPAYADNPNFDGFTTDMIDNTYGYALGIRDVWQNALDYYFGKKTFSDFVSDGFRLATENNLDFLHDFFQSINENDMTPIDILRFITNSLNNYISNNGGTLQNFPLNDGAYWKVGNFTFKPLNLAEVNDCASANVSPLGPWSSQKQPCSGVVAFWPDGTRYKNSTMFRVFGDVGTSQSLTINNIEVLFNNTVDVVIHYSIRYINKGVSYTFNGNDTIRFDYSDWGDYTEDDLFQITDTPDVDNLSDDDLIKYIENIINKLDSAYPDLSTLEGKLQEVINLLNKLQNGNCNCNELAQAVYALLAYLQDNGNGNVNNDLNDTLTDLKNLLQYDINLSPIKNRLDDIYNVLSDISFKLDEDETVETVEQNIEDSYAEFKKKVEDKFQVSTIKKSINNFTSCVFGKVAFENDSSTGQLMVASVYGDGSRSVSDIFYPLSLKFEYGGYTYDLFEWSGFIPATTMSTFRSFVRFIIWITFLIGLFRSLPGIIGGFGSVTAPVDKQLTSKFDEGYGD